METRIKNFKEHENNVLRSALSQTPSSNEGTVLKLRWQRATNYEALYEFALWLRNENCILLQWGHPPVVIENGEESFLLIADFTIRFKSPNAYTLSYRHNENELVLEEDARAGLLLYWLNRLSLSNAPRYQNNESLPERA